MLARPELWFNPRHKILTNILGVSIGMSYVDNVRHKALPEGKLLRGRIPGIPCRVHFMLVWARAPVQQERPPLPPLPPLHIKEEIIHNFMTWLYVECSFHKWPVFCLSPRDQTVMRGGILGAGREDDFSPISKQLVVSLTWMMVKPLNKYFLESRNVIYHPAELSWWCQRMFCPRTEL